MKNIYKNSPKNLSKAKRILKKNNVIAVPTETVYGLAGNSYSDSAVKKIYKLKKRPKKNPLIIHYYSIKNLEKDAYLNDEFLKLYKKFSPGALTYILQKKKSSKISSLANGNLKSIAVRFPSNKVIKGLLKNLNFPLAIPSANVSASVSPTKATDVIDEFGKRINFVLDGGRSNIGLESTVINLCGKTKILRPGAISPNEIKKVLKKKILISKKPKKINSPGLSNRHYSPGIPIKLNCKKSGYKDAFIVFGKKYRNKKHFFNLSKKGNLNEAGKNLYKTLRKIKNLKYKKICIVKIPNKNMGIAINDRLRRASK